MMRWIYTLLLFVSHFTVAQTPLHFVELGAEPAQCRLYNYQSGNGVVYAAVAGGVPSYDYVWININTTDSTTNSTWGGLNPGWYTIKVTDAVGDTLVDSVYVDSLNPHSSFDISSNQPFTGLSGLVIGEAPLAVDLEITNQQWLAYPNWPMFDNRFFRWKLGNQGWTDSLSLADAFQQNMHFNTQSIQEVCLAVWNKNSCADTSCVSFNILFPSSFVSGPNTLATISSNKSQNQITVFLEEEGQYEFLIYSSQGILLENHTIDELCNVLPFYKSSGNYIYQLKNKLTGEVLEASQFLF
ncbi:hypothetical protein K6119_15400 [Paracrocinitomix mangrovi]|uniref:hypothetical protein n=1 Tax=Paracrocinitomix mangrovi TaxID=2862509 RepID=UPI001EDABC0F|nr:hypothetical protein [Paracrocinitomix mangrovi]UKN01114.1 hypothetical protein K6119_15400 [Paracrocinitomix mangrovi]